MTIARHAVERHWQSGLQALGGKQWQAAVQAFEACTRLSPADALMWLNLARARLKLGQFDPATEAAQQAFDLDPSQVLACRLLAEILMHQSRFSEAALVFDRLPETAARDHDWYSAHGNALFLARRPQDAVGMFFQALALKVDAPLVHYRLGLCFKDMDMAQEATECFRTAVTLDTGYVRALALSLLVHEGRQACDWAGVAEDTQALLAALDSEDTAVGEQLSPFALLAIEASAAQQRRSGALRLQGLCKQVKVLPPAPVRMPGPIRVGYLSSDFHQHATAVLMTEMLERRNRADFEVFLYSHSVDDGTGITRRVRAACEHFVDVTHLSNEAVAQRMRADRLDIAIDLKGHTRGSRFELLAARPAPVQVAFLGFPATTGADFIDYLIGDPVVTPLAHAGHFSEHIAQLPHCYQPNDRQRLLLPAPSRASLGLPDDAVVLCCFNQTYKISPHMLDLWTRILRDAPGTVLWMLAWNPHAQANLLRELTDRGVSPSRIFWADKLPLEHHVARLRVADLFLDTWPCNAHTTASEALWAGVPVLTVPGQTFASRVAASLVTACGLPDLAASDEDSYVALATALAQEPQTLAGLKRHLDQHRLELPLFDAAQHMRDFEALLRRMVARHSAGLAPEALAAEAPQAPVPHSLRAADAAGPPPALPLSPITRLPTDRHRGLKVAMITPYYKESRDMLERCMRSVQAQGLEVVHILVADGHAQDWIDGWPVRHLRLDCSHGDFGNTPRALGGLLAASEGFDAIGFIDADNWLEPQHVRDCLAAALAAPQAVDYVVAGRRLVRMDGSVMPVMTSDDRDGSHVDTNCYFMLPGSFHTLGQWAVMPKPLSCVGDRVFLASLRQQGLRAARSAAASVNYLCTWACLFTAIGEAVPDYAKSSIDLGPTSAWWRTLDPRQRDVVQRLANTPVQAWVS